MSLNRRSFAARTFAGAAATGLGLALPAALAQFFTNPRSMLEFAKVVSIYPSTPASYDDPFFSAKPVAIEDSAKPIAKEIVSKQTELKPTIPHFKDVNDILLQEIQKALFEGKDPQQALSDAVAAANALLP